MVDAQWIRDKIPEIDNDAEARAVIQALGFDRPPSTRNTTTPDQAVEALRRVAIREFVKWLAATRRYESISALERDRVAAVFSVVRETAPSVRALVDDLSLPEGRAVAMLGRMRYGEANRFEAMRYSALADLVRRGQANPRSKKDEVEVLVFAADANRELFNALIQMAVDPTVTKQVSSDVTPKRMAQHGYQWEMKPDNWDRFVAWLDDRAKKAKAKFSGPTP